MWDDGLGGQLHTPRQTRRVPYFTYGVFESWQPRSAGAPTELAATLASLRLAPASSA